MDVILASQAHQVPQVGLPQIEPVTSATILNTNPEGAKLFVIKEKFLFLKIKMPNDKIEITEGPFEGKDATFLYKKSNERVKVLLKFINQVITAEIPESDIGRKEVYESFKF